MLLFTHQTQKEVYIITSFQLTKWAEIYLAEYKEQSHHHETSKQYVARKMNLSLQQTSRILYYYDCIPEVQDLIIKNKLALSCTDQIGCKPKAVQRKIYDILIQADSEKNVLARDRVVVPVARMVAENPTITWDAVKKEIRLIGKKQKTKPEPKKGDSKRQIGDSFARRVVHLMREHGYADAKSVTKRSYDYKLDASATDINGATYAIQCKYHEKASEGCEGVVEADEARKNYGTDYAVAVTNTQFGVVAKRVAETLGVILWDGEFLRQNFDWDGKL